MRKLIVSTGILATLLLGACSDDNVKDDVEKEVVEETVKLEVKLATPLETVETFMRSYYFDEGTYKEYKQVFADQEAVKPEEEFNTYREGNDAASVFGEVKVETMEDALKHLKIKEIDETNAEVYLVSDVNDEEFKTATSYWILEKKDDKWLMK